MSFTTWVRAQDASGQFDVRKGDDLRDGVTLVEGYPEHIGFTGRPGKPFVNIGIAAAEGYKGLSKQDLIDEIDRRNSEAVIADDVIEIDSERPTIATLTGLLKADDKARKEAAAAAAEAAGVEPTAVEDDEVDDTDSSDGETSGTGEDTTTEASTPGTESE